MIRQERKEWRGVGPLTRRKERDRKTGSIKTSSARAKRVNWYGKRNEEKEGQLWWGQAQEVTGGGGVGSSDEKFAEQDVCVFCETGGRLPREVSR